MTEHPTTSRTSLWTRGLTSVASRTSVLATGLPPDLETRGVTSLLALTRALCGLMVAYFLLLHFHFRHRLPAGHDLDLNATYTAIGVMFVLTVLFSGYLHRCSKSNAGKLNMGLLFQVVFCFAVSMTDVIAGRNGAPTEGFSFVAVLIVLFPLFVPSTIQRTMIAAMASATTGPLATLLYDFWVGLPLPTLADLFDWYLANYIVVALVARTAVMTRTLSRAETTARRMGSYSLQKKLGRGGMGEVWCATHEMLSRPAAIKLIQPEALGGGGADTLRRRFEREAQATANLHSPHSINLYDFGVAEDGAFYYVMELLDGLSAKDIVKKHGPLPAGRTVAILRQVCDALQDAHLSDFIHRDIKPGNIFLCRYGHKTDYVKVLDFGLVKGGSEEDATLTGEDAITGTPAFMAPEMALGGEIDGRADIYSLGCVAYWLLTGQLIFEREQPMQVAVAHIQQEPLPPSARTEVPIPEDLEALVMMCLAKDPADRPQSAADLEQRLADLDCAGDWTAVHSRSWWDTHRPAPLRSPAKSGEE